jgi:hypothetical protein
LRDFVDPASLLGAAVYDQPEQENQVLAEEPLLVNATY